MCSKYVCCLCIWCRNCCCQTEEDYPDSDIVLNDIRRQDNGAFRMEMEENQSIQTEQDIIPENSETKPKIEAHQAPPQAPAGQSYSTTIPKPQDDQQADRPNATNGAYAFAIDPVVGQPTGDLYYAIYDFDVSVAPYIQCCKGERLIVLDKNDSWSLVALENNQQGYIPSSYIRPMESLESYDWYFGALSRQESAKLLSRPPANRGTFMVRDCLSKPGLFSLSVLQSGREVSHYVIFQANNEHFIEHGTTFPDVPALINHYRGIPVKENATGIVGRLITPCKQLPAPPILSLRLNSMRVDRSEVKRMEMLDAGNFGKVYKGRWGRHFVAIKTPKPGAMNTKEFLAEAERMSQLRHKNVVQFFAVVAEEPLYIITEFMCNGSLLDYMREGPGTEHWTLLEQITVAIQVAEGMSYLEAMKYIHCDLRAANVLVGENLVCKIADFGLSKFLQDAEYVAKGRSFPVKWTAPEIIAHNTYTHKSDVWSYGCLLYEVATRGAVLYAGMENKEVEKYVKNGNFLKQPESCDDLLYSIMTQCWGKTMEDRPNFASIKKFLCDNFSALDEPFFDNEQK